MMPPIKAYLLEYTTKPNGHTFRDLDQSKQEIRILTLLSGSPGSDIYCKIQHERLLEVGEFAALSYCWGAAGETAPIFIDNERVYVRKNLWSLWHLRELKGTIKIWVDIVCINQRSNHERNHQVRLMKDIFSTAVAVYAWLGVSTPRMVNAVEIIKQGLTRPRKKSLTHRKSRRAAELRLLQVLFDQEYWSRLWIIQEIVLAPDIQIIIESITLSWRELVGAYKRPALTTSRTGKKIFDQIMNLKGLDGRSNSAKSLETLFLRFFHAQCKDPQDKIYGMLGMTATWDREQVVVDYQASILRVCLENMRLLVPQELPLLEDAFKRVDFVFSDTALLLQNIRDFSNNKVLRSELPRRMNYETSGRIRPHTCYTFAAKRRSEDRFSPLTENNKSESFDLYMSWLSSMRQWPCNKSVLYTTCVHSEDDVVVDLGSRTLFIGRRHGPRIKGIELGMMAAPFMSNDSTIGQTIDLNHWVDGLVPKDEIHCEVETPSSYVLNVQMNGAAFVEMIRCRYQTTVDSDGLSSLSSMIVPWNPQILLHYPDTTSVFELDLPPVETLLGESVTSPNAYHLGLFIKRLDYEVFLTTQFLEFALAHRLSGRDFYENIETRDLVNVFSGVGLRSEIKVWREIEIHSLKHGPAQQNLICE